MTVAHIHGVGSGPSYRENKNAYQGLKARQDSSNPMHEVHRRHAGRVRYSTGDIATFYSDFERCFTSVYCLRLTLRCGHSNITQDTESCKHRWGKDWRRKSFCLQSFPGPLRSPVSAILPPALNIQTHRPLTWAVGMPCSS